MNTLLVGLNAKFYHTNLAIRNIKKYCGFSNIDIFEATINDNIDYVLEKTLETGADIIGFSCYIWNIEMVLYLSENIKKINPEIIIIFGGPEVSYDILNLLKNNFVDYIVIGEGERAFKELLYGLEGKIDINKINGIAYCVDGKIIVQSWEDYVNLDEIPMAYEKDEDLNNRLVYYETSRGCPFRCSYCLSSLDNKLRYVSIDKVRQDLKWFSDKKVKIVKLIDRSFNSNLKRAEDILSCIKALPEGTIFHFEINPELVNREFIKSLKGLEDRIQFEVGVQTTNPQSLEEISRTSDVKRTLEGVKMLHDAGIKLHVDLIAGLPFDNFFTFSSSFDDVYNLNPNEIQLGFLKLLKGTLLREKAEKYGIVYDSKPPYEILYNKDINYQELRILKGIAFLVNKYYNSGKFVNTLKYLTDKFNRPFEFYLSLYKYWKDNELIYKNHSLKSLYDIIYEFSKKHMDVDIHLLKDLIKFDFMYFNKDKELPVRLKDSDKNMLNYIKNYIRDEDWLKDNLPQVLCLSSLDRAKKISYGYFKYDIADENKKKDLCCIFFHDINKTYFTKVDIH
ncbi:MAG: B12-binding domain-containing radical SAM protein [Thermoanaerobacteraceae bacterium]|nr:B12-binding domain-containing radical SAM protein [Thermoanaerobacteraceae bacterium]